MYTLLWGRATAATGRPSFVRASFPTWRQSPICRYRWPLFPTFTRRMLKKMNPFVPVWNSMNWVPPT